MTYRATFIVIAPKACTVSRNYDSLPEDREIENQIAKLGEVSQVIINPSH